MSERPTITSGFLAVVAATAGTVAVAETTGLRIGVGGAGVGLVVFFLGVVLARSRSRVLGAILILAGLGGAGGGFAYGASTASDQLHIALVAPGVLGTFFVALGVAPLRRSGSRRFVKIATWLVFIGPVLSAGMEYTDPSNAYDIVRVLGATVAAALLWDLGENSVSLGRQIGREARSFWNETVHGFGTVLMGAVSAGIAYVSYGFSVGTPALESVVFLLVSIVLLVTFLHG